MQSERCDARSRALESFARNGKNCGVKSGLSQATRIEVPSLAEAHSMSMHRPKSLRSILLLTVGLAGFAATEVTAQDITTGIVTNLLFDGTTNDSSSNRFTFTQAGVMRFAPDRFGNANRALEFLTPSSDERFLKGPGPNLANQSLTVAFWVKKNYSGGDGVGVFGLFADGAPDSPGKRLTVFLNYGLSIRFTFWYDDLDTPTPLAAGSWYHLGFTFDNVTKTRRIYINGQLDSTKQAAQGFSGGNILQITSKYTTLDDFRLYNRALTAQDVAALAAYQTPPETPPSITSQPSSQVVASGGAATLTVAATGTGPLSYQWAKDGVNLVGATNATYAIANMQPKNIGNYSVLVSGLLGSVTSANASLTIPGVSAELWRGLVAYYTFSGTADDQSAYGNHATVAGNSQFTTNGLSGGALRVIGDSALMYSGGGHALLPKFGTYMNAGFTVSFWAKDESLINNFAVHNASYLTFGPLDQPQVDIALNSETQKIGFTVEGATTRIDVFAPLSFSTALASWKHVVLTYTPGKFVAYLNGAKIDERAMTANIFPCSTAGLGRSWWNGGASSAARMSATFDNVRIYSRTLADSDVQQLYASEAPPELIVAASVVSPPTNQTVVAGATAILSVTAVGTSPLSYQWRKEGQSIPGATLAALTLNGVQPTDAGNYRVLVTNATGSALSATATLTVGIAAAISTHPQSQVANSGTTATFTIVGTGTAPFAYQWRKDGTAISGATNAILTLSSVQPTDAGNYSVMVTNFAGTVTSTPATLAVNIAATISTQPTSQTVVAGTTATLSVNAAGTAPFTYQWQKDGQSIPGATQTELSILTTRAGTAAYSVAITNAAGTTTSQPATLTVKTANPGRLANLSIRTAAGAGNGSLIVGFVVGGSGTTGTAALLARAAGPALVQFGVVGALSDPILTLFNNGRLIASNDDWIGAVIGPVSSSVGAFSFSSGSKDAAISSSLSIGGYTAQVSDVAGAAGVALVELYEASPGFSYVRPRLVNVSARASAGSGGGTMIAGFVIRGETPVTVLVRAIGPSLTQFGVTGVLTNPKLTLFRDSTIVAVNDNWADVGLSAISSTASAVGAFALQTNSLDAALLATLEPGSYTAQISGSDATTTGVALVEIYEVP